MEDELEAIKKLLSVTEKALKELQRENRRTASGWRLAEGSFLYKARRLLSCRRKLS
jgi:hypothetical protein